jgi:hypothetical protein
MPEMPATRPLKAINSADAVPIMIPPASAGSHENSKISIKCLLFIKFRRMDYPEQL